MLLSLVLLELGIGLIATVLQRVGEDLVTQNLEAVLGADLLSLALNSQLESVAQLAPVLSHAVATGLITTNYSFNDDAVQRTHLAFLAAANTVNSAARNEYWAGFCAVGNDLIIHEVYNRSH